MYDSDAITPPSTPTKASHSKSSSASSARSMLGLMRGESVSSTRSRRRGDSISSLTSWCRGISIDESEKPGNTELLTFKYWLSDYEVLDKKQPLGSGLWSDVYLARPTLPRPSASVSTLATPSYPLTSHHSLITGNGCINDPSIPTPPITPTCSRNSSVSKRPLPTLPSAYAIKFPASRSAKHVLAAESLVLSYLSRFPDSSHYIVPFYGQDTRTSALVLKAMDVTLECWIQTDLNALAEGARARRLAGVFPQIAVALIRGLEWMIENGCVHADIKPSNILIDLSSSPPLALYSDFSSATLNHHLTDTNSSSAPLGGGTWDFLDPSLLLKPTSPSPSPTPTPESDTWSLALTFLYFILGSSPFECAGSNVFRRREIVKHGTPLAYTGYGDQGIRNVARLKAVERELGWGVCSWLGRVLVRDATKRVGLGEWRGEL
ncbi:uncharacterized protein BDR25DRAFT_172899, partial [Lindgomyces ingoldianus]